MTGLVEGVLAGQVNATARMISRVERNVPGLEAELAALHRAGGRARVVGVTGVAGSGKSTLVSALTLELRRRGATVGILAVDPSSPYSGGSILGDRIRMDAVSDDPGVFIRSMATRGALGGLARATADAVTVLDAAGKDVVLVETVGVGQDEVDIVRASHTTVVVSAPGLGDEVQAIKAGLLEIADVHVVNKMDRDGASRTVAELKSMLELAPPNPWPPPVVPTVANQSVGVAALADACEEHHAWMVSSGELAQREQAMARARLRAAITSLVLDGLGDPARGAAFEAAAEKIRHRALDPRSAARELLSEESET